MAITAYASEFGRRPSEVWEDYLAHPKDYQLIFGYRRFVAAKQKEEEEKLKKKHRSG